MGVAAAKEAAQINDLLSRQETLNIIFAAAPSQTSFFCRLYFRKILNGNASMPFIWMNILVCNRMRHNYSVFFSKKKYSGKAIFKHVYYLNGQATDTTAEGRRYASLLEQTLLISYSWALEVKIIQSRFQ